MKGWLSVIYFACVLFVSLYNRLIIASLGSGGIGLTAKSSELGLLYV